MREQKLVPCPRCEGTGKIVPHYRPGMVAVCYYCAGRGTVPAKDAR